MAAQARKVRLPWCGGSTRIGLVMKHLSAPFRGTSGLLPSRRPVLVMWMDQGTRMYD